MSFTYLLNVQGVPQKGSHLSFSKFYTMSIYFCQTSNNFCHYLFPQKNFCTFIFSSGRDWFDRIGTIPRSVFSKAGIVINVPRLL